MLNKVLYISLLTKILKKLKLLYIFHEEVIIYKRNFDENRRISFLIKKYNVFTKHMEILAKVRNIIKNKTNSEFIYSKKYLKTEKKKK